MKTDTETANLVLDKADPSVAESFDGCKPGDTYEVVTADENEVVLKPVGAAAETEEPADEPVVEETPAPAVSKNPAVSKLMGKY